MKNRRGILCTVLVGLVILARAGAQQPATAENSASPQMEKLAKALAGDWNTTETMERGEIFRDGGSRRGVVHAHLAAGGTTLIYEVNSNGDAGKLDGFIAIWWDKTAKLYHFFACFNDPEHPCTARGDAHWEGDRLVNNYFEIVKGKKTRWQDSFSFTPTTHTLVAAEDVGHGKMKSVITTRATRR